MKKVTKQYKNTLMGSIRQRIGQSQQWWAYYLDVTLAQVKMAESGGRSLSGAAMIKLGKIEILYASTIAKQIPAPATAGMEPQLPDIATGRSKLERQAAKIYSQLYTVQKNLYKMQLQYWQARNSAALAGYLLAELPPDDENSSEKLSLDLLQRYAQKQVAACGPEAQTYLQWKLDCAVYAISRAEALSGTDRVRAS